MEKKGVVFNYGKKLNGLIYSWGKNENGELSQGLSKNILIPRKAKTPKGEVVGEIESGGIHSGLITSQGTLYICGNNLMGKLGIPDLTSTNILSFQPIPILLHNKVQQIALGEYHTICLMQDGTVYTWGGNLHQKLGPRSTKESSTPGIVESLSREPGRIMSVGCGEFHSVALSSSGMVYTWGGGGSPYNRGQLGHGHSNDIEVPAKIMELTGKQVVHITAGGYHTLALTSDNILYAWGSGYYGECGYGEFANTLLPKRVIFSPNYKDDPNFSPPKFSLDNYEENNPEIADISAGGHHTMVLTQSGELYTFGFAQHGQLGLHNTINQCKPQLVKDFKDIPIKQIKAGWNHSVVLTTSCDLYTCGNGQHGQLGLGDEESRSQFTFVSILGPKNIKKICVGGNHTWAILEEDCPLKVDYEPPVPLAAKVIPKKEMELTDAENKLIEMHNDQLKRCKFYLQVTYTDIAYCHRFIRFTIPERNILSAKVKFQEFMKETQNSEKGLLYHRWQDDEQIEIDPENMAAPPKSFKTKSFTIMILVDPTKNDPPIPPSDQFNNFKNEIAQGLDSPDAVGVVINIKEEMIHLNKGKDAQLSQWVKIFENNMRIFCSEPPVYFELRPYLFKE